MTISTDILAASAGSARLDPLELFLQADIVVQAVMLGLILASIWVWMIIVSFVLRMKRLESAADVYEEDFWRAKDQEAVLERLSELGDVTVLRTDEQGTIELVTDRQQMRVKMER